KENPIPPPTFSTILEIPDTIIDKYNTDQKKRYRQERNRFRIEVLTLVVIAIYTGIAGYQGYKMREATEAAKTSADAAEKAAGVADNTFKQNKDFASKTLKEMQNQSTAMRNAASAAKQQAEI